jgi:hypothetical protein
LKQVENNKLELYYLGYRKYVNGITLLEEMINCFAGHSNFPVESLEVKNFKIMNFVHNNGIILFDAKSRKVDVSLTLSGNGEKRKISFVQNPNDPVVTIKEDYDRSKFITKYYSKGEGTTIAELHNILNYRDFIRAIVEANYHFCCELVPTNHVSIGYIQNLPLKYWQHITSTSLSCKIDNIFKGVRYFVIRNKLAPTPENFTTDFCFNI